MIEISPDLKIEKIRLGVPRSIGLIRTTKNLKRNGGTAK